MGRLQELIFNFDAHIQDALTRNYRMIVRALRIFWPEILGIAVAAGALSGFVVLLGENKVKPVLNGVLGLIAITGFTTAGLLAKMKNQAQAMVTRLRRTSTPTSSPSPSRPPPDTVRVRQQSPADGA